MYNSASLDLLLLAAGFGLRLRPLTEVIPKCLLPVCGTPLLDGHLARLLKSGSSSLVVNTHHLADQLESHLRDHPECARINISHERVILGTGGAIVHAREYLGTDPVAVVNADTLFAAPLADAVSFHHQTQALATMILSDSAIHRNVFVSGNRVERIDRDQTSSGAFTFTGTHLLSQEVIDRLPAGGFCDVRDLYDTLAREERLGAFVVEDSHHPLHDVGTPRAYLEAHRLCAGDNCLRYGFPPPATRETHSALKGFGHIDPHATVAAGASIVDSVILAGAIIEEGARVERSIVGPGARASGDILDRLLVGNASEPL